MALVEVNSVSKSYARRAGLRSESRMVVENVNLTIEAGETLGLVGESGSGKTTLARMILGLVRPSGGSVRVDGVDVARASADELRRLRRQMQPVFQDPYAALNPRMNVLEIVTEPLLIHRSDASLERASSGQERRTALRSKAIELLGEVGLDESALGRHPHEFSGGQRQRINIARALALRPKLLILDEPVSALDVSVGAQIVNLLRAAAARARPDLSLHLPLHAAGALSEHAHRGDGARTAGGDGRGRGAVRPSAGGLHAPTDCGHAGVALGRGLSAAAQFPTYFGCC